MVLEPFSSQLAGAKLAQWMFPQSPAFGPQPKQKGPSCAQSKPGSLAKCWATKGFQSTNHTFFSPSFCIWCCFLLLFHWGEAQFWGTCSTRWLALPCHSGRWHQTEWESFQRSGETRDLSDPAALEGVEGSCAQTQGHVFILSDHTTKNCTVSSEMFSYSWTFLSQKIWNRVICTSHHLCISLVKRLAHQHRYFSFQPSSQIIVAFVGLWEDQGKLQTLHIYLSIYLNKSILHWQNDS